MSSSLIHVAEQASDFAAFIVDREAYTDAGGYEYPARTIAHVQIDDVDMTMTAEQVERLHAAFGAALAEYRQVAATAAA